nr:extracellular solute-binding protein [Lachnospiraceae bacterium]
HVYGQQTDSPLNDLIDEFNNTIGAKEGIRIKVTNVSNTSEIHEAVLRCANNEPGAGALPDLFISYPKTVVAMSDRDILVDFNDYFSEEELGEYTSEFIDEGRIDDRLLVFPVAKSTEIMFVNKTLFDRFKDECNVSYEDLTTWESLLAVCELYYKWTDDMTPDIEKDGKSMLVHDYWFDYFQVGVTSLGDEFFSEDGVKTGDTFKRAFDTMSGAAVTGGVWLKEGFATEPLRTGDAIVSVASSASVLYYDDKVTYSDNSSEDVEIIAMPAPFFEDGKKLVMQRGAGMCMVKSDKKKEEAGVRFIKWLTEPETNLRFVTALGYMPVTDKAFEELPKACEEIESPKYKSLYEAYVKTNEEYEYYNMPLLDYYLDTESMFESELRSIFRGAYEKYDGNNLVMLENDSYKRLKDSLKSR